MIDLLPARLRNSADGTARIAVPADAAMQWALAAWIQAQAAQAMADLFGPVYVAGGGASVASSVDPSDPTANNVVQIEAVEGWPVEEVRAQERFARHVVVSAPRQVTIDQDWSAAVITLRADGAVQKYQANLSSPAQDPNLPERRFSYASVEPLADRDVPLWFVITHGEQGLLGGEQPLFDLRLPPQGIVFYDNLAPGPDGIADGTVGIPPVLSTLPAPPPAPPPPPPKPGKPPTAGGGPPQPGDPTLSLSGPYRLLAVVPDLDHPDATVERYVRFYAARDSVWECGALVTAPKQNQFPANTRRNEVQATFALNGQFFDGGNSEVGGFELLSDTTQFVLNGEISSLDMRVTVRITASGVHDLAIGFRSDVTMTFTLVQFWARSLAPRRPLGVSV